MLDYRQDETQTLEKQPLEIPEALEEALHHLLHQIYPERDQESLLQSVTRAFWPDQQTLRATRKLPTDRLWDETDNYVITYGNTLTDGEHKPLDLLQAFLVEHLDGVVSGVHILPYFPFTCDEGFGITDYRAVNGVLGDWEDIERIASHFKLMSDLVINHCSSQSRMFNDYLQGHSPFDGFFFEASPDEDLSEVVRPRAHPLLREVETANGTKHVWCTFSHDQVDFNFANPDVLIEFLRILRFHIDKGARTIRLDAVAFLWKELGTSCIHLPQTHAVVRLLRLLTDFCEETIVLITETNVPNAENLSYFGNGNEAHAVYNFSLPPLLLHGLLNGTSKHLNAWQLSMPPIQEGCTYFNFTASHDGIGVRPAEGLLSDQELGDMIATVEKFGARISMRQVAGGSERPYEINVTLRDALKGTEKGEDQWNVERFLCSQAIAMALIGIPGIYIHSLLGTHNDYEGVEKSGQNRAINRHRWHLPDLLDALGDSESAHRCIFDEMKRMLQIRREQHAFHPNAAQFTLQLGDALFGFRRQCLDGEQQIYAIHNLTDERVSLSPVELNFVDDERWTDLLNSEVIDPHCEEIVFAPYQARWISNFPRVSA